MLIRAARDDDLDAIIELLKDCGLPSDDVLESPIDFVVAVDGGQLAAVVGLERYAEVALLRSVAVAANARGRALARRLCADLLADADAAGCRAVYLLTLDAADFFAPLGFAAVARDTVPQAIRDSAEFSQLCPERALLMCRA